MRKMVIPRFTSTRGWLPCFRPGTASQGLMLPHGPLWVPAYVGWWHLTIQAVVAQTDLGAAGMVVEDMSFHGAVLLLCQ